MKGTLEDGLPRPEQDEAGRRFELHDEGLGVLDLEAVDERHQLLAGRVLGGPALDGGDAVLGRDGSAVVPGEAVAQREGVGELVGRDLVLVDHLRLDLAVRVGGKQRVVDHVAVVADDVGRGPDRIDDLEVRVHHGPQRLLRVRGCGCSKADCGNRGCGDRERASARMAHRLRLPLAEDGKRQSPELWPPTLAGCGLHNSARRQVKA